jgi:glycosyltransferase 2 family protein
MKVARSKWIAFGSSVLLFAVIIYILKREQDLATLINIWQRTDRIAILLGIAIMLGVHLIAAWRVKIIMNAEQADAGLLSLFRIQFISQFVAHGAPISGLADLARAAILKLRFDLAIGRSIRIVFYERIFGALGTVVCGILALIVQLFAPASPSLLLGQTLFWAVGVVGIGTLVATSRLHIQTGIDMLDRITRAVQGVGHLLLRPRIAFLLTLASALQVFGLALVFIVLAGGMHINSSPQQIILFMPLIYFVSALPFFYLGWGAREAMVIATIVQSGGITTAEAVAISVGYGVIVFVSSLPGAVFWLMRPTMRKAVQVQVGTY